MWCVDDLDVMKDHQSHQHAQRTRINYESLMVMVAELSCLAWPRVCLEMVHHLVVFAFWAVIIVGFFHYHRMMKIHSRRGPSHCPASVVDDKEC